jgi:hypothetical protein
MTEKRKYQPTSRVTLDAQRQADLITAVRLGNPFKTAALFAGIDETTLVKWRAKGKAALQLPSGKRNPTDRKFADFVVGFDKALAEANVRAQQTIHALMTMNLQNATPEQQRVALSAAQFHLTHRDPKNYSTQVRTEITGADSGPVDLALTNGEDVFKILLDAKAYEDAQDADN